MIALALRGLAAAPAALGADRPRDPARRRDDRRHLRPDGPDPHGVRGHRADRQPGIDVGGPPKTEFGGHVRRPPAPRGARRARRRRARRRTCRGQLWESGALVVDGERVAAISRPSSSMSTLGEPFDPTTRSPAATGRPGEVGVDRARPPRTRACASASGSAWRRAPASSRSRSSGSSTTATSRRSAARACSPRRCRSMQEWFDREGEVSSSVVAAAEAACRRDSSPRMRAGTAPDLEVRTGAADAQQQADDINAAIGGFLTPMLLALAGAALLVGAFIIFNTFSITVAQRTREFALLRALGATRRQIVAAVAGEAMILGVDRIGARAARRPRLREAPRRAVRRRRLRHPARRHASWRRARSPSSLGVGIGVTVLAALVPALRATRVSPVAGAARGAPGRRAAPPAPGRA